MRGVEPVRRRRLLLRRRTEIAEAVHPLAANHASHADSHERDAQQLSHVERQRSLERLLHLLGILDEEACDEDVRQTESEEEARAHTLRRAAVEVPADEEQQSVGDGLVELSRVARHGVYLLEDERPRHVGYLADNLRVHEVAQAYEARRERRSDGYVVEHLPDVHLRAAHVDEQSEHQAQRTAVRGESAIAREAPSAVRQEVDGQEYLHEVFPRREEEVGLVEEAMAKTCSGEYADEAVDEERVEQLGLHLLLLVQTLHAEVSQRKTHEPAERVPVELKRAELEGCSARIPKDV